MPTLPCSLSRYRRTLALVSVVCLVVDAIDQTALSQPWMRILSNAIAMAMASCVSIYGGYSAKRLSRTLDALKALVNRSQRLQASVLRYMADRLRNRTEHVVPSRSTGNCAHHCVGTNSSACVRVAVKPSKQSTTLPGKRPLLVVRWMTASSKQSLPLLPLNRVCA